MITTFIIVLLLLLIPSSLLQFLISSILNLNCGFFRYNRNKLFIKITFHSSLPVFDVLFLVLIDQNENKLFTCLYCVISAIGFFLSRISFCRYYMQKQPLRGVPRKRCSENKQQINRGTPISFILICFYGKIELTYLFPYIFLYTQDVFSWLFLKFSRNLSVAN